jgi:hypothetical protein
VTRTRPKPPQPPRKPISSLTKPAKPHVEPNPRPRLRRNLLLSESRLTLNPPSRLPFPAAAGGWRGRGDPHLPRRWGWVPYRDRTRRPNNLPSSNLHSRSSPGTLLSRLSRPSRLLRRIHRNLADLPNPLLRSTSNNQRLVDPRFKLAHSRHSAAGDDPVLGGVALGSLDSGEFRPAAGGKPARSLDLAAPNFETTRGAR